MPSKDPKQMPAWPEGKAPATLHELYRCLEVSRACSAEEARQFVASLPDDKRPDTPKAVAIELIKAGKLTRFQAQAVLTGKIKYLSFGEYVVLERLGRGGMGEVLKAEHRRMQRRVALKVISGSAMKDADAVRRFQREVHAAARLIHPNIVTAFDANELEGVHFLVMEYVDGRDLAQVIHDQGPLPVATAVDYVLQAARGLAYAHGKGIVHRDIKPGNLLVDREGTVKILDMGLARIDLGPGGSMELTNTGQVMGTVDYMAPEQAEDTHSADARADIYSLGCTLYRLLSGEPLYGGESVVKKLLAHRGAPIPPLAAVCPAAPAALDAVFRKMVAKRPEERQQSMAKVVAELENVLRGLTVAEPTVGSTEVTTDLKLSEFFAAIGPRSGKSGPTATAEKRSTKVASGNDVTQDFAKGDTTTRGLTGLGSAAPDRHGIGNRGQGTGNKTVGWRLARKLVPPYVIAIAAALGGLALAAAGIVVFLPTSDGTIRVEINDPSIEVTVSGSGYKIKGKTEEIHVKPGEHTLHVKTGELEFDTSKFVLGKGDNPPLKVELLPGEVQVMHSNGRLLGERARPKEIAASSGKPGSAGAPGRTTTATPAPTAGEWITLFNGRDLYGWLQKGHAGWSVKDGLLTGESVGAVGWLMSSREFGEFELELEYRLPPGGNSGVFLRAPENGNITGGEFNEIQLLDDSALKFASVLPQGRNGALFSQIAPTKAPIKAANEWRKLAARVVGSRVQVTLDGVEVLDGPLRAGTPARGHIGLQLYAPGIVFRNIRLREQNTAQIPSAAAAQRTIDLLPLVDLKRDVVSGQWRQTPEGLVAEPTGMAGEDRGKRLQLPYTPPEEYDFEIEFTPTAANFRTTQHFWAGGRSITWEYDSKPLGQAEFISGFSRLDGLQAQQSPGSLKRDASLLITGSRNRSRIEVRRRSLRVLLNDKEIIAWQGDLTRFSDSDLRDELPDPRRLGVITYQTTATFHKITVREVNGRGSFAAGVTPPEHANIAK
jgi:serine/threonine protein kinase